MRENREQAHRMWRTREAGCVWEDNEVENGFDGLAERKRFHDKRGCDRRPDVGSKGYTKQKGLNSHKRAEHLTSCVVKGCSDKKIKCGCIEKENPTP